MKTLSNTFLVLATLVSFSATGATHKEIFGHLKGSSVTSCWTRTYSAEHLKKNPKQTVKTIKLSLSQEEVDGAYAHGAYLSVTLKSYLQLNAMTLDIYTEAGKTFGDFEVDDSKLEFVSVKNNQLTVRNYTGLTLFTESGEFRIENFKGGDDVFILNRAADGDCEYTRE